MPASQNYINAYRELFQSGLVKDKVLQRHVKEYSKIDALLPALHSFFYIVQPAKGSYAFIGKQQKAITGLDNKIFLEKGVHAFLQRVHPDQRAILVNEVYQDFRAWFIEAKNQVNFRNIVFQYNFRLINSSGSYINLMENVYALEIDDHGMVSLS